ncbi:MAG: hypothetical protein WBF67_09685, partial [Olleya sp.]
TAVTITTDDITSTSAYNSGASETCPNIEANSSCIFSYDQEDSLDLGTLTIDNIEITNVEYYLTN